MKKRKEVTYIDCRKFDKQYMGEMRHFIELSFLEHKDNNTRLESYKLLTTQNKLEKALAYRGIKGLEKSKKYELWLADYKGNGKLTFSGIKPL